MLLSYKLNIINIWQAIYQMNENDFNDITKYIFKNDFQEKVIFYLFFV